MELFLAYVLFANLYGFFIVYLDKQYAKKHKRRIREKTIFLTALLFGSLGVYTSMQMFRHKTKHPSFTIGIPLIFLVQAIGVYIYFF